MKPASIKPVRCAIYTRVSTDHGLDQEFNSLDAQYEAASAYIKSQAHAGWTLIVKSHPSATPFSRPRTTPLRSRDRRRGAPHSRAEPVLAGGEWRAGGYARFLKRQLSLPVSMMSQWWVSRSSMAVVILASPNTCGQSAKARLVVISSEVFS